MEIVAQVAGIRQQGIGQGDAALGRLHQRKGAELLQTGGAEGPAQPTLGLLRRIKTSWHQGIGQMDIKLVVTDQAGHLFNQVHLALEVQGPLGWHRHGPTVIIGLQLAPQGFEGALDAAVIEILGFTPHQHGPQQVVQGIAIQNHRGVRGLGATVQPASLNMGSRQLLQQGHRPIGRRQSVFAGQTLFKTTAGLAAQSDTAGRASNGLRRKDGCFQPDTGSALVHRLSRAPHDPGQGNGLIGIGDQEGLGAKGAVLPIKSDKTFALATLAQPQLGRIRRARGQPGQGLPVEGVERLAGFEHHQIGDVHHVVDRPQAGPLQPPLQPGRRSCHL